MIRFLPHIGFTFWFSLIAFQVCADIAPPMTKPPLPLYARQSSNALLAASDHLTLPVQITKGYVFLDGKVKDRSGVFMFDTGAPGYLVLTPDARGVLVKAGRLRPSGNSFVIEGLTYQAIVLTADVPSVITGKSNSLKAGYSFLRHYRSVWNFNKQTITLLK